MIARAALWIGTYPADGPDAPAGTGEGVWRAELTDAGLTGHLAAATPAPSFLAVSADGRTLFAAGETSPGSVTRFAVAPDGALAQRERVASGGVHPCHLLLHPDERALYVANYSSGSLAVLQLEPAEDGLRVAGGVAQVFEHSGRGPHAERQEGPHVHSTLLAPGGRVLLAIDLGTDEVRRYLVGPDGRLTVDGVAARLPPGTGPRHGLVLGEHLVVVGELSGTLHLLRWDPATASAHEVDVAPVCGPHEGPSLAAHVLEDGEDLLVSVRGPDVVARFGVRDGRLVHRGDTPVGAWPRHMALVGGRLVVGAQGGGTVTAYPASASPAGGVGAAVLAVPTPACVVPA